MLDTAVQEKAGSETAAQVIAKVKRVTRRRFTAEEKIRIVMEGMKREIPIGDHCRQEGIHPTVYYLWLKEFMEAGKARLRGDTHRQATEHEVVTLRRDHDRVKVLLADLVLENALLKKSLLGSDDPGISA